MPIEVKPEPLTICRNCRHRKSLKGGRMEDGRVTTARVDVCEAAAFEEPAPVDFVTGETYYVGPPACRDKNTDGNCPHYKAKPKP